MPLFNKYNYSCRFANQNGTPARKGRRQGSALLLVLLVTSLLLVIVLSFTVYIRLELRTINNKVFRARAESNAKVAMNLAVANLQKLSGRDARVTARSDIIQSGNVENPFWTGVWDAQTEEFLGWLVSEGDLDTESMMSPASSISGESILILDKAVNEVSSQQVRVPVDVIDNNRYGYWVSEENSKVNLAPVDDRPLINFSFNRRDATGGGGRNIDPQAQIYRNKIRQIETPFWRGSGVLSDWASNPNPLWTLAGQEKLQKLSRPDDLALLGDPNNLPAETIHQWTTASWSLLTDVTRDQLKYDYHNVFEMPNSLLDGDWNLYHWHSVYADSTSETNPYPLRMWSDGVEERASYAQIPVEILVRLAVYADSPGTDPSSPLKVAVQVEAEIWNPYNVEMREQANHPLAFKISGLPKMTVRAGAETFEIELDDLVDNSNGKPTYFYAFWDSSRVYAGGQITTFYTVSSTNPAGVSSNRIADTNTAFRMSPYSAGTQGAVVHTFDSMQVPASVNSLDIELEATETDTVSDSDFTSHQDTLSTDNFQVETRQLIYIGDRPLEKHWWQVFVPEQGFSASNLSKPKTDTSFVAGYGVEIKKDLVEALKIHDVRTMPYRYEMLAPTGSGGNYSQDPFDNFNGIPLTGDGTDYLFNDQQIALFDVPVNQNFSIGVLRNAMANTTYKIGSQFNPTPVFDENSDNWLFDIGFMSGLPPRLVGGGEVPTSDLLDRRWDNPYIELYEDADNTLPTTNNIERNNNLGLGQAKGGAAHMLIRGGFNFNSTSEGAWEGVLSGLTLKDLSDTAENEEFLYFDEALNDEVPLELNRAFSRFPSTASNASEVLAEEDLRLLGGNDLKDIAFTQPFRSLINDEATLLGQKIRAVLKQRGKPYFRLQDFVDEGVIEKLLDPDEVNAVTTINENFKDFKMTPVYLSQSDIMHPLAPVATLRGDTFCIRGYGAYGAPSGSAVEVVCEVIVQRVPTPLEPRATPPDPDVEPDAYFKLNAIEHPFGRRYRILSFRWLSPEEI